MGSGIVSGQSSIFNINEGFILSTGFILSEQRSYKVESDCRSQVTTMPQAGHKQTVRLDRIDRTIAEYVIVFKVKGGYS